MPGFPLSHSDTYRRSYAQTAQSLYELELQILTNQLALLRFESEELKDSVAKSKAEIQALITDSQKLMTRFDKLSSNIREGLHSMVEKSWGDLAKALESNQKKVFVEIPSRKKSKPK